MGHDLLPIDGHVVGNLTSSLLLKMAIQFVDLRSKTVVFRLFLYVYRRVYYGFVQKGILFSDKPTLGTHEKNEFILYIYISFGMYGASLAQCFSPSQT